MPYLTRQGFPGSAANKESSRTSVEIIVNPKYKVYITGNDELLLKIHDLMIQHKPVFTPYLGLAQFIASTDFQVTTIEDCEIVENVDIDIIGAFIRGHHGELDFEKINKMPKESKLRITEFEGLRGIKPPRDFEHAVFTVNLDGGAVPLKNAKNIFKITAWDKNVPIF
jgi:CRISPR-associated protein Cas5h